MNTLGLAADQLPPDDAPPLDLTGREQSIRDIAFARPIGYRPLQMDLFLPAPQNRPAPLVVHLYGGGFAMGSHQRDPLGLHLTEQLVAKGFAVARPQYRHSREAVFPAQFHDVTAALRWLRHHASALQLDPDRVFAWGASSGGHLAAMLAVAGGDPDLVGTVGQPGPAVGVRASVAWSAPVDLARLPGPPRDSPFHRLGANPHDWLLGGPADTVPDRARTACTAAHVTATAAPLRVVHGEDDDGIPIDQAEQLVEAYRAAGAPVEFTPLPGVGHFFDEATRAAQTDAGIAFLTRWS